MSYSLWLQPAPKSALHHFASAQIEAHAAAHCAHRFAPHVTLLGGVAFESDAAAVAACRALALRGLPAPRCRVARAEAGASHYQCVFLRVSDEERLSAAHDAAREACTLPAPAGSHFVPHLSLLYSDVDTATRAKVAACAGEALEAALPEASEREFLPTTVFVWRTPPGRTDDWVMLAEVPTFTAQP